MAHIARGKGNSGDAAAQRLLQVTMREPTAKTIFLKDYTPTDW